VTNKKLKRSGAKSSSKSTTQNIDTNSGTADLAYLLAFYTQGIRPDMDPDQVFDFLYKSFEEMNNSGVSGITGDELYQLATQLSLAPIKSSDDSKRSQLN
jgi:hypothetical protein